MWSSSDDSGVESDDGPRQRRGILHGIFSDFEIRKRQGKREPPEPKACEQPGSEDSESSYSESNHVQRIQDLERENKELRLALLRRSLRSSCMVDSKTDKNVRFSIHPQSDAVQSDELVSVQSEEQVRRILSTASAPAAFTVMAMSSEGEEEEDDVLGLNGPRRSSTTKLFEMDWGSIASARRESKSLYSIGVDVDDPFKHFSHEAFGAVGSRKVSADTGSRKVSGDTGGIDNHRALNPRGKEMPEIEEGSHWKAFNQVLDELPKTAREIIWQQLDRYQAEIKYLQSVIAVYEDMYIDSSFQLFGPGARVSRTDAPTASASSLSRRRASHTCCFKDSLPMVSQKNVRPLSRERRRSPSALASSRQVQASSNPYLSETSAVSQGWTQAGQEWLMQMDKKNAGASHPRRKQSRSPHTPIEVVPTSAATQKSSEESCPVS